MAAGQFQPLLRYMCSLDKHQKAAKNQTIPNAW